MEEKWKIKFHFHLLKSLLNKEDFKVLVEVEEKYFKIP